MKYERLTPRILLSDVVKGYDLRDDVLSKTFGGYNVIELIDRLVELENKIESGELIERTSEECSAVRKQDVEVCKKVVKECLQVLRDMRMVYIHGYYSSGWNNCIDLAIEQLTERYNIDTEEVCEE